MNKSLQRVVVAIYIDPDFYPPTINAILNLAELYKEVIVISRNNAICDYVYPSNVRLKKIGKYCPVREMEKQNVLEKGFYFLNFVLNLHRYIRSKRTNLVLLYDSIALYGFFLGKSVVRKNEKIIWYHNHDMPLKSLTNQFSVGGLAAKYETKGMQYISFFSLPSKERIQSYPEIKDSIPIFIIPNYPSLKVYDSLPVKYKKEGVLRIIFQGFIGSGLCLEEVIELLPQKINGNTLYLVLKGSVKDEYKSYLNSLAEKFHVTDQLIWVPIGPYYKVLEITSSCNIGLGINRNDDIISKTLGTASNKIYEYAASGLPVLLPDTKQYRMYLEKYEWGFFTTGTPDSIKQNLEVISQNLPHLGKAARSDFEQKLNFENVFSNVLKKVISFEN